MVQDKTKIRDGEMHPGCGDLWRAYDIKTKAHNTFDLAFDPEN